MCDLTSYQSCTGEIMNILTKMTSQYEQGTTFWNIILYSHVYSLHVVIFIAFITYMIRIMEVGAKTVFSWNSYNKTNKEYRQSTTVLTMGLFVWKEIIFKPNVGPIITENRHDDPIVF